MVPTSDRRHREGANVRTTSGVEAVVWLKRIGIAALAALAVIGWSLAISRGQDVSDLAAANRRQQPIVDYNNARSERADCKDSYRDRFLVDIATPDPAARRDLLAQDYVDLARLEALCPAPTKPKFDSDGNVTAQPQIFDQHPAPTVVPPSTTAPAGSPP